jgi:6-phospho-3-hexuloisomerase
MDVARLTQIILHENTGLLSQIDTEQIRFFTESLEKAKRVFCGAQGRSGNILRCFCMRLMHLGYESYFAGETITPRIGKQDMVVVLSGSGETRCTVDMASMARLEGVNSFGIVGVEASSLAETLDHVVFLPGGAKTRRPQEAGCSVQPAGSLFEQAAFLLLEAIVLELYQRQGSNGGALLERHTNLE